MLSRPINAEESMIDIILLLGFALALDSFAVSASVGAAGLSRSRHLGLALSFGICDGLASLLGAMLGISLDDISDWLHWIGPLAVAAYALYVLLLTKLTVSSRTSMNARWLVFGMPLCLSLDNFLTGGRLSGLELPAPVLAMLFGLCSGLLAFAGLRLGGWASACWPCQARRTGLLGLFLLAVVLAVLQE
jgi:putative Mn2+ efflux pump MntP